MAFKWPNVSVNFEMVDLFSHWY